MFFGIVFCGGEVVFCDFFTQLSLYGPVLFYFDLIFVLMNFNNISIGWNRDILSRNLFFSSEIFFFCTGRAFGAAHSPPGKRQTDRQTEWIEGKKEGKCERISLFLGNGGVTRKKKLPVEIYSVKIHINDASLFLV